MERKYKFNIVSLPATEIAFIKCYIGTSFQEIKSKDAFSTEEIEQTIKLFCKIYNYSTPAKIVSYDTGSIIFHLPEFFIENPWLITVLINIISNNSFLDFDDPDLKIIDQVKIECSTTAGWSSEDYLSHLEDKKQSATKFINSILTENDDLNHELEGEWPDYPEYYFFDIKNYLPQTISKDVKKDLLYILETLTDILSWTGFETDKDTQILLEEALIPFAYEVDFSGNTLSYSIETPPSDPALIILMLDEYLLNIAGENIEGYFFNIQEAY